MAGRPSSDWGEVCPSANRAIRSALLRQEASNPQGELRMGGKKIVWPGAEVETLADETAPGHDPSRLGVPRSLSNRLNLHVMPAAKRANARDWLAR